MIILDGVVMAPMVNNIDYLDIKLMLTVLVSTVHFKNVPKI